MSGVSIRRARPDDAEAIAAYHRRCFVASFGSRPEMRTPAESSMRDELRSWFEDGSGFETWVAVDADAVPVGHCTVFDNHLVHLFVDPPHHGTGLGRRLLELGESRMQAGGHRHLELHTRVENESAIAFYEHAGWRLTEQVIETVDHDVTYDERVLVKDVPEA